MNKPKISVIMPSLNVGDYMEQCLSSVLNQSLKDIEVICVDAGSTDQTLDIIKKHQKNDSRINNFNSEINYAKNGVLEISIKVNYQGNTLKFNYVLDETGLISEV